MSFASIFTILLGACAFAFIALVAAIAFAVQRKWRGMLVGLVFLVLFSLAAVGTAVGLVFHTTTAIARTAVEMNAEAARRDQARRAPLQALTPAQDWSKVDDEFFNYDGFRDWYRVPVRYPYDIEMIDELKRGTLKHNDAGGKSSSGQGISTDVDDIAAYAADANIFVYRQETREGKMTLGIFTFDDEKNETFNDEPALWTQARLKGWTAPEELKTVEQQFQSYWK